MVKKYLDNKGIKYETVNLDDNPEKRQELLNITGAMTVPITENNGQYVIGWNPAQLAAII
jgi:glutaredoxin